MSFDPVESAGEPVNSSTKRLSVDFFNRFVGLATPEALGAIRFWVFSILVVNVIWEDLPSVSWLPTQLRVEMGMMSLMHSIPGWDSIYTNYAALSIFKIATVATLILAMIGLKTRWSVPCATILVLIYGGILREYSHLYHTCLLSIQVAIVMSFMPCGEGLSVDQFFKKKKNFDENKNSPPQKLAVFGWSRYVCWIVVAGAYVSAGLCKIGNGGFWWWHGSNLKKIVLTDTLNPMQFEWGLEHLLASVPVVVFSLMGLSAVLIESLYGFVLFSKRARLVFPLMAVGMHFGIWICQGILFFDLILLQAIFFDLSRLLPQRWRTEITDDEQIISEPQQVLHQKWFNVCLLVVLVICTCWKFRVEKYPATAWQMYSGTSKNDVITYRKVLAVYSDGHREEAHFEKWIGAMADTRYRDVFYKNQKVQKAFFDAVIELANRDETNEQIVRFEVETYEWNFMADANDPNFGAIKNVASYATRDSSIE